MFHLTDIRHSQEIPTKKFTLSWTISWITERTTKWNVYCEILIILQRDATIVIISISISIYGRYEIYYKQIFNTNILHWYNTNYNI